MEIRKERYNKNMSTQTFTSLTPRHNEKLWVQKYRPSCIDECCLPDQLANQLRPYEQSSVVLPTLIFQGQAGVGKTTAAYAIAAARKATVFFVNGSLNGGIDTLRNDIYNFAVTRGIDGDSSGNRIVIIDEADYLSTNTQAAMRGVVEELSRVCSFILTCNKPERLIEPLVSRSVVVNFSFSAADKKKIGVNTVRRIEAILKAENITYELPVVAKIVMKHYPDIRKVLNVIQGYSKGGGTLDAGALSKNAGEIDIDTLIPLIKSKDLAGMRAWLSNNMDGDIDSIYRLVYDRLYEKLIPGSIVSMILLVHQYMSQRPNVADPEISAIAFLVHVSASVQWKDTE